MKKILLLVTVLSMAFASCDRDDSHVVAPGNPDTPRGGVIVAFNTAGVTNKKFEDTRLYGFDAAGKMILHKYHATQKELSSDMFQLESGAYTFIAVLNAGEAFSPETKADMPPHHVTMNRFMSLVKRSEAKYPDMLTGMVNRSITAGKVERVEIPLAGKSGGFTTVTTVIATITLPDAEFAGYQKARGRATADYNPRGTLEFYQEEVLISRTTAILAPTATGGKYTLAAEVFDGQYDLALWVDYTASGSKEDKWYDTRDLQAIKLLHAGKTYAAGSDSREVFYYTGKITATGGEMATAFTTARPQAKYTLVANDIARYKELMAANPGKYVPLDELSVSILYEGYLPCGFNALTGKPNDSGTGFKTGKNPLPAVGATDTGVKIGSDHVLVNGTGSSVTVTVVVTDKAGRAVSRVSGVKIDYKRGMHTTVRGDFLTAGVINPGININPDWDGVHEVIF